MHSVEDSLLTSTQSLDDSMWPNLQWPLMHNNITRNDLDELIAFLQRDDPRLTQSEQVEAFEREWSAWLGINYSVFVNSGSSANLLAIAALRDRVGPGEIIVPALTWVSDIAAVLHCGFTPVFVDSDPRTLGLDPRQVFENITPRTRAVFLTHVLGLNALTDELVSGLAERGIPLIEDACEAHGATFSGRKVGTIGLMSNFSFYYAHHMSTIEGGMICTNDPDLYQRLRLLRSHGMVRESTSEVLKRAYERCHPDLNPDFIFARPAYNVRSTELNAVLGRSQLKRLDACNAVRRTNFKLFLDHLDPELYQTDFAVDGNANYALILIVKRPDPGLRDLVAHALRCCGVEYRRGLSGGGNQLRQPYLRDRLGSEVLAHLPVVDHVHFYGFYVGNYPDLAERHILTLCEVLNTLPSRANSGGTRCGRV